MSCAIKVTNSTLTKNMMLKFRNQKVGHTEVEEMAGRLVAQQKTSDKTKEKKYQIVKDLMKHKMENVQDCEKIARKELEFMNIVNVEINLIWKNGKDKNIQKVEWAVAQNKVVKEDLEEFKGGKIGDNQLDELEKVLHAGR